MLTTHQTLLQIKNITEPDKRHSAAISQSRASRAGTGQFDDQGARLPVESSHPSITLDGLTRKNCIHDRWAHYYIIPHNTGKGTNSPVSYHRHRRVLYLGKETIRRQEGLRTDPRPSLQSSPIQASSIHTGPSTRLHCCPTHSDRSTRLLALLWSALLSLLCSPTLLLYFSLTTYSRTLSCLSGRYHPSLFALYQTDYRPGCSPVQSRSSRVSPHPPLLVLPRVESKWSAVWDLGKKSHLLGWGSVCGCGQYLHQV